MKHRADPVRRRLTRHCAVLARASAGLTLPTSLVTAMALPAQAHTAPPPAASPAGAAPTSAAQAGGSRGGGVPPGRIVDELRPTMGHPCGMGRERARGTVRCAVRACVLRAVLVLSLLVAPAVASAEPVAAGPLAGPVGHDLEPSVGDGAPLADDGHREDDAGAARQDRGNAATGDGGAPRDHDRGEEHSHHHHGDADPGVLLVTSSPVLAQGRPAPPGTATSVPAWVWDDGHRPG